MTAVTLPRVEPTAIQAARYRLARALYLFLSAVLISGVLLAASIHNRRFHKGTFADDYSADFDVNRVEYPLIGGMSLDRTAHEVYLAIGSQTRIPLWRMMWARPLN